MQENKTLKEIKDSVCDGLILNSPNVNGILDILNSANDFERTYLSNQGQAFLVQITLKRLELIAFLIIKMKQAVEIEDFEYAKDIAAAKEFYLSDVLHVYQGKYGFSLLRDDFFKKYFYTLNSLLKEFENTNIIDRENKVRLNYDSRDIALFLTIIELIKKDEIIWSWNKFQLKTSDFISALNSNNKLQMESYPSGALEREVKSIIQNVYRNVTKPTIMIIEAMSHHENEIKEFVAEINENISSTHLLKVGIKEVSVLEPVVHLIRTD